MRILKAVSRSASQVCGIEALALALGLAFCANAEDRFAPIRRHPVNPHYLEFRGHPIILVSSAEHYGAVINPDFDWKRYLETLTRDGMNYTRVFVGPYLEGEQDIDWMKYNNTLAPRPGKLLAPWARSNMPGYHNGGNKFDLDAWDEHYWKRMNAFVAMAAREGIIVEVTLFGNQYGDSQWAQSPLKASNNLQGVGGRWKDFQTLRDPELTRRQEQLVLKIVTELKDADNVIYEISNEPFNNQVDAKAVNDWHRHMAAFIARQEEVLRVKHLVAANEAIHDDPNVSVLNWHYVANLPKLHDEYGLNKPIAMDETNGSLIHAGVDDVRVEAWDWICSGGACFNNLSWDFTPEDPTGKPGSAVRGQLKVLRDFVGVLNFIGMKPAANTFSKPLGDGVFARALAEPGMLYWIYLHHSKHRQYDSFITGYEAKKGQHQESLELAIPPGSYQVQWFRPRDGKLWREDQIKHDGNNLLLTSPHYEDADVTVVIRKCVEVNLLGTDFEGGANKTYGTEFGGRANVNFVYAKPTGALASMQASFQFKSESAVQLSLLLDAKENDGPLGCRIEIKLNDTVLLSGPNGFPKVWRVRAFDIPKDLLRAGTNTIMIRNLEETGSAGLQPWFMVSRCGIGPVGSSLPKLVSFQKYSVSLPNEARPIPETLPPGKKPGFAIRGIKGWNWTVDQYLEEIPILAEYRMNFLMNCYLSNFDTDGKWVNKWWEPLSAKRKQDYIKIFRECKRYHINFCFAVHPQLASPRPLDPNKMEDIDDYYRHFAWAQEQGVKWFSISLDDVSWGERGPAADGSAHAKLVNIIFNRLREKDPDAQMIFCPVPYWGDGTKMEDREYLGSLAREMHPDVYVFWTGNEVVPARMTAQAARSYQATVKHRLIIWENYPVNDASPTMHLGPITGRESELAEIADGYMSNALCPQNQINRIPLLTCADFAWNPNGYDPDRSIGQALLRWGKTAAQRQVLKELVELYPGAILSQPSNTGYRPVYNAVIAQFTDKLDSSTQEARAFVASVEDLEKRMERAFPSLFGDARKTLRQNINVMNQLLNGK